MDGQEEVDETPQAEELEAGASAAPEGEEEDEDILPLDHSDRLDPRINKTIRIAKERGKKLSKLQERVSELERLQSDHQAIQAAIESGRLVFADQVKAQEALAEGAFGDAEIDSIAEELGRDPVKGTEKLLKALAETRKQLRDVGGKIEGTVNSGIMAGLTGYLGTQFKQRGVDLTGAQMNLVRETYAARVRAQGFELSKEPPTVSAAILNDLAGAFEPRKVKPKESASPDTTSRRGAPLKARSPVGARKATLTKDDILAELRAGTL